MATPKKKIEMSAEHEADLRVISDRLYQEQLNQSWCEEFDRLLENWDKRISGVMPKPTPSVRGYIYMKHAVVIPVADKAEAGEVVRKMRDRSLSTELIAEFGTGKTEYYDSNQRTYGV